MAKPLLFGDATLDADRIEEIRAQDDIGWDRSYVPGYSETRRANELRVRDGKKPIPQDRLQWIRLNHTDGKEMGDRDMLGWAMQGYQFITMAELEARGFGMPPTAYIDTQGRIRREDLALAFVDNTQAQKNKARQEAEKLATQNSKLQAPSSESPEIKWEAHRDEVDDLANIGARYLPQ